MKRIIGFLLTLSLLVAAVGCQRTSEVQSVSGTKMTTAGDIQANKDGKTVEQQNIADRIKMDNMPGSIKHLYIISAYSGQVIIYSTVRGKVTSSGKRLTPSEAYTVNTNGNYSFSFPIGNSTYYTNQVLGEDGTYGQSAEYLYWWDTRGVFHQHFVTGGQIPHISDQPLAVKGIIINMELTQK